MYEAYVTVVGNAATQVDFRTTESGVPVARFRLASTVRRFDRSRGGWADSYTSFYTVWARRALAVNLASSVAIGEPLIVRGQLRVRERERERERGTDGRGSVSADLLASAIGHDLCRGTSAFVRVSQAVPGLTADGSGGGVRASLSSLPSPSSPPPPPPPRELAEADARETSEPPDAVGPPESPDVPEAKIPNLLAPP